ncbi:MAG: PssE/Cps14G family polysaccharide biosynthesis glycosyltransferase [Lachnospiraceae bacterium]
MIFVTTGSQKFQFNRLLEKLDTLIEQGVIEDSVFAQIGYSDYMPKHYQYTQFLNRDEFAEHMKDCTTVITHGGTGAIIGAVRQGKKVIAVPRLAKYGEHVDDHQVQLLTQFDEMNIICSCYEMDKLGEMIQDLEKMEFTPYISNTRTIIDDIEQYLESIWGK